MYLRRFLLLLEAWNSQLFPKYVYIDIYLLTLNNDRFFYNQSEILQLIRYEH